MLNRLLVIISRYNTRNHPIIVSEVEQKKLGSIGNYWSYFKREYLLDSEIMAFGCFTSAFVSITSVI